MNTEETLPTDLSGGPSRRMVLAAGAAGASTLVLAACSKAAGPSTTAPGAGSGGPGSGGAGSGGAAVLAPLSSVAVGSAISATDGSGKDIIISRTGQATVAAFSAICPHQGCTVDATFVCPCHGSTFDSKTGARLSGPAPTGLATVPVSISGDNIVAG